MTEIANAYAEALTRTTTSSNTVGGANQVRLTHTPGSDERWWYFWNCEIDSAGVNTDARARFRNETAAADWGNVNSQMSEVTNRINVAGGKEHTYGTSPGSQDIDIDFWAEGVADAGCTNAHIFAIKAGADDKHAAADASNGSASSTWETAVTLTETLSGNYAFFCFCELNVGVASKAIGIRADKGGTKYGEMFMTTLVTDNWRTWATGFVLEGLGGSQTVTIEFQSVDNASTVNVRKCRIFALNLDRFHAYDFVENRVRDTNATTTPEDQSSLTFSPADARNHVAFGGLIGDYDLNTSKGIYEFERDGTTINRPEEEPLVANDDMSMFSLKRESLSTGSKVYKTQKWAGAATRTVGAAESFILVIDLEEDAGGGGGAGGDGRGWMWCG